MKLVMFDMDGTLTDSFSLEENCYVLAIEQALGLPHVVTEWDSYTHTSSSYCLEEIVRRNRGTPPTAAESRAVQARIVELMSEITRQRGRRTNEIPGSAAALRALRDAGYGVALASGDWEATARHKLASAGIPFESLPSAFCDVAHARTAIMLASLERAAAHYGCAQFERVVYFGDAAWDVRACRELGWPLIGMDAGERPGLLAHLGVKPVLTDYLPLDKFLAALGEAQVPPAVAG